MLSGQGLDVETTWRGHVELRARAVDGHPMLPGEEPTTQVFSTMDTLRLAQGVGLGLLRPATQRAQVVYCDVACHCGDCVASTTNYQAP